MFAVRRVRSCFAGPHALGAAVFIGPHCHGHDRVGDGGSGDHFELYDYNDTDELIDAASYHGTDPATTTDPMTSPSRDRTFDYDFIGNRKTFFAASETTNYCTNAVNAYTARWSTTSCSSPDETFTYDADGNVTRDGTYDYTWDAENRLTSVTPRNPAIGNKKILFSYDYLNRRVTKSVFRWNEQGNGGFGAWMTSSEKELRFMYDDWNLILELDGLSSNASLRKYTWDADLSGSLYGAGGIGGLLAAHDQSQSKDYLYFSDANGNVGQLVDVSDGSIAARYEYDPYGNIVASSGDYADVNPYRFSTKNYDAETGQYYYGRRFYFPQWGRWRNRDPMFESRIIEPLYRNSLVSAPNNQEYQFYVYVSNVPIGAIDPIGLLMRLNRVRNHDLKGPCGKYDARWFVSWVEGTYAPRDGYVIQQVNVYSRCKKCGEPGDVDVLPPEGQTPDLVYWEAFPVRHKDKRAESDFAQLTPQPNSRGWNIQTGEIKFVCKSGVGELSQQGWTDGIVGTFPSCNGNNTWTAGNLLHTRVRQHGGIIIMNTGRECSLALQDQGGIAVATNQSIVPGQDLKAQVK